MAHPFAKFAQLQQAASDALSYHDEALTEAVLHHCALKVASATAPTDELVGRYVDAEIEAKHRLLKIMTKDLEGIAVKGRYLRALSQCEDWERDYGTIEALIAGMEAAHAA